MLTKHKKGDMVYIPSHTKVMYIQDTENPHFPTLSFIKKTEQPSLAVFIESNESFKEWAKVFLVEESSFGFIKAKDIY